MSVRNSNVQISVLKGIGIISIVLGHTAFFSVKYVYMYHLALFFFVSGFLYNEDKYGNNVSALFAARMHSVMPQYLTYSILFLSIRNWMIKNNLYNESVEMLSKRDFVQNFSTATFFASGEYVGSAFWFLPVLITANVIFGSIIVLSNHFDSKYKLFVRYMGFVIVGAIGVLFIQKEIFLTFHYEEVLLVVPILALGQMYKVYKEKFDKINNWIIAGLALFVVIIIPITSGTYIELSMNRIINPFIFYFATLCGMIFWVFMSTQIVKCKILARMLSLCGEYSFDIMALHILTTKLVDLIYLSYIDPSAGNKETFVYSVKELWPVYLIAGVCGPILFRKTVNRVWKYVVKFLKGKNVLSNI